MRLFSERERAYEAKFAHDETMLFHAQMKRDKIIGRWAGGILGLSEKETEDYIRALIHLDLQRVDEEDLFFRLKEDFDQRKIGQSDGVLLIALEAAMQQALALNR